MHMLARVRGFFVLYKYLAAVNWIFVLLCVLGDWKFNFCYEHESSNPDRSLSHFWYLHVPRLTRLQFVWFLSWHHWVLYPWSERSKHARGREFWIEPWTYIISYIFIFIPWIRIGLQKSIWIWKKSNLLKSKSEVNIKVYIHFSY